MTPEYVVAGLGNPGPKYDGTRHNVGFRVIDALSARHGAKVKKLKFHGLYGECAINGVRVLLLKPQTFMNLSGQSVRACLDFYKLPPGRFIVTYDEAALPAGKLRIREKGSDGGHNGMKDILYHLRTDAFTRVRVGVGAPPRPDYGLADWVLGTYSGEDKKSIDAAIVSACDAIEELVLRESNNPTK